MDRARIVLTALILAALAAPIVGCGPKPTPTTGPDAPKAPGVPPNGP